MWAGNLGAHQGGRASLDYRLREAPHLQEQVLYLLQDAYESLQGGLATIHELASAPSLQVRSQEHIEEGQAEAAESDLDGGSESSFTDSDADEPSPERRLSTLHADIREVTDCLLRLSVAIANPAPHERFRKFGAGPLEDISYREPHDISYVQDKFPKVSSEMATMLGKAITRRRQFFRYRQAHHDKLASGLGESSVLGPTTEEEDDAHTELFPKTQASTLPEHIKDMSDLDLRNGVINEDNGSDTAASVTSYATSAGFIADAGNGANVVPPPPLRVPPLPQGAEAGNFEYAMSSATSAPTHASLRIVLTPMQISTDAAVGGLTSHSIIGKHGLAPFSATTLAAPPLQAHLSHRHIPNASADQLEAVVAVSEGQASNDETVRCPICHHSVVGLRQYTRHVGRHLEQLALFALPALEGDRGESDKEDETDSTTSGADADGGQTVGQTPAPEDGESSAMLASENQPTGQDRADRPGAGVAAAGRQPILRLVPLNATFERRTIMVPFYPKTLRIGRNTDTNVPSTSNGYFNSNVLSRQHAEIWADLHGRIWIRDIGSLNGTFINGARLSRHNQVSDPHELKALDHLDLGVNLQTKDLRHHEEAEQEDEQRSVEHWQRQLDFEGGNELLRTTTELELADLEAEKAQQRSVFRDSSYVDQLMTQSAEASGKEEEQVLEKSQFRKERHFSEIKLAKEVEELERREAKKMEEPPIRFKDAVGRKFNFPFHLCQTWQGMEELINQAFLHVDVIGPHVLEGHYNLIGPNDEVILPTVWEKVITPGWTINMEMWPNLDKVPLRGPTQVPPIRFKDAVGRKFTFPFHLCQTWQDMEELINQAFLHVDVIGPHVLEGHYNLIGPNDEVILPTVWEKVITPGWTINMEMWPNLDMWPLRGYRGHVNRMAAKSPSSSSLHSSLGGGKPQWQDWYNRMGDAGPSAPNPQPPTPPPPPHPPKTLLDWLGGGRPKRIDRKPKEKAAEEVIATYKAKEAEHIG
ncbi:uncharacterized protein B0T15DRAFT_488345 [Chaetomium strumarium]|uniref:FHA domain-containing protein n=1 Tax=Chaetomium strumarium TaxID=1170767 RepID=A0AAJ0H0K9_9PEZI|nr:hypothetical protein B0T15DRAFT_488345 [Chaetomium strumarium]